MNKFNLLDCELSELETFIKENDIKKFKAKQIFKWLHQKNARKIELMTDLSLNERNFLYEKAYIPYLEILNHQVSKIDKTEKYLFQLKDKETIETVLLRHKKRNTLCVSTQVGCPIKCPFCATGRSGFIRNLQLFEILSQIYTVNSRLLKKGSSLTNIVFMGMGEPLLNTENLMKSINILSDKIGLNISKRKITISTAGIIPEIEKIIDNNMPVGLAISLHASNDDTRNELVPLNKKYPLSDLLVVLRSYQEITHRKLTFEYILINGINMSDSDAENLKFILKGLDYLINLIPYNSVEGVEYKSPSKQKIDRFYKKLKYELGMNVVIREEKGADIGGACGQLRRAKR